MGYPWHQKYLNNPCKNERAEIERDGSEPVHFTSVRNGAVPSQSHQAKYERHVQMQYAKAKERAVG